MATAAKIVMRKVTNETGEVVLVSMALRRNFWKRVASKQVPLLAAAATRLMPLHASSCAAERNWSAWGRNYTALRNALSKETADKCIYIKSNLAVHDAEQIELGLLD
jgi:hypothetical protein